MAEEGLGKESGKGSLEPQVRTLRRMFEGIGEAKASPKGKRGKEVKDPGLGLGPGKGELEKRITQVTAKPTEVSDSESP